MQKIRRILVLLQLGLASNRGFLSGIAKFRKRHAYWRVTVLPIDTLRSIPAADLNGFDGIITAQPKTTLLKEDLENTSLPMAVLGNTTPKQPHRRRNTVFVKDNADGVGRLAAQHFMSLGKFNSYAFVHTSLQGQWAERRFRGFAKTLAQRKVRPVVVNTGSADGSKADIAALSGALRGLARPAAVFCAYDNRALQVIDLCAEEDIGVPQEISIVGVDNDILLCDLANPSLTSIAPDQSKIGEIAAEELDHLIRRPNRPNKTITVADAKVVERESTAPVTPAKHLVERAQQFIEANACSGITVNDVVSHLGVSRSLADRRFRFFTKTTINDELNRVKIDAVKRLLTDSDLPIYRITERCGFSVPQYAKRLFKQVTGRTMSEWRDSAARS